MARLAACIVAALSIIWNFAGADDGLGLKRGGDGHDVTLSGVSSGAAMAVQYAVAHSGSVVGVGSIAGPAWGCASGLASRAINDCMCGRREISPKVALVREMSGMGKIDPLLSGKPSMLKRSFVYQSRLDHTVVEKSGKTSIKFLMGLIGTPPVESWGTSGNGSDRAGHGIISPDGSDSCFADGRENSFIRKCGAADNAGDLLNALYGNGQAYDIRQRKSHVPDTEVWTFDQKSLIEEVKNAGNLPVAWDFPLWIGGYVSVRRANFDLADTGFIYVPPSCRKENSGCRVHVALHGCKQDAKEFAAKAGYNNWADFYHMIVVYPAIEPSFAMEGEVCDVGTLDPTLVDGKVKPNPNGCWDWWGYLDSKLPSDKTPKDRYLTKDAPQMRVIQRIIEEVIKY